MTTSSGAYYLGHLSYIGRGFLGWQRQRAWGTVEKQPSGRGYISLQETIEVALGKALHQKDPITITATSRTDAGTHALWVCRLVEKK